MPEITKFLGIIIKMFFAKSEINPPYIHAYYNDYEAEISINDFTVLEGDLPPRVLGYVIEWMTIYKEDLREIWETQQFRKLPPLV